MVTKVGRKWVYFTKSWHQCENIVLGRIDRFHIETGYIDDGKYTSPGRVWSSYEEYTQSQLQNKAWANFQELVHKRNALPDADYLTELVAQLTEMINHTETST